MVGARIGKGSSLEAAQAAFAGIYPVLQAQGIRAVTRPVQPDTLELPPMPDEALAALVGALAGSGAGVVGLTSQTKNLEESFLSLTKGDGEVA